MGYAFWGSGRGEGDREFRMWRRKEITPTRSESESKKRDQAEKRPTAVRGDEEVCQHGDVVTAAQVSVVTACLMFLPLHLSLTSLLSRSSLPVLCSYLFISLSLPLFLELQTFYFLFLHHGLLVKVRTRHRTSRSPFAISERTESPAVKEKLRSRHRSHTPSGKPRAQPPRNPIPRLEVSSACNDFHLETSANQKFQNHSHLL